MATAGSIHTIAAGTALIMVSNFMLITNTIHNMKEHFALGF